MMEQLVRLQLVEFAKHDAAETITNEQGAHWYNVNVNDSSQIPKALRPDGGYFDNAIAFSENDLSFEEREECWKLYQETYSTSLVRGIRALQRVPIDGDWNMDTEDSMLEAGSEAALA
jgi:hypothetical protein